MAKIEKPALGSKAWLYDEDIRSGGAAARWSEVRITGNRGAGIKVMWGGHELRMELDRGRWTGVNTHGHKPWIVLTVAERDAEIWIAMHRDRLVAAVKACSDVDVLKQVADLIGYVALRAAADKLGGGA